jgi:glucose/mannose-6-phosphate isomerase
MNLDDLSRFRQLDPQNMLSMIDELPDQLLAAWELGLTFPLPDISDVSQVVICGLGGSAIGGDLVASYAAPLASVPISVWRNYDLPSHAKNPQTFLIFSSHSGNTEETLSAFESARQAKARLLTVSTGGALANEAMDADLPAWIFKHDGQPRAAIGFSFGLLLAALYRLGLIPDQSAEIVAAVASMRSQQEALRADVATVNNPAKRMAGQLVERWPIFIGADLLAPVARRWRTQVAELAKAVAQYEELPEADHNMLAGVVHPDPLFDRTMVLFLRAHANHPRNLLRIEATRQIFMVEGFNTDIIDAAGETRLAQQWTSLHFGDYTSYYLAMAYGVDPTPVDAIETLKLRLKAAGG